MLQIHKFVFEMSRQFPLSVGSAQIGGHDKVKEQTHSVNFSNMYLWYGAGGSNWERERQQRGREEGDEGDTPASLHAQPLFTLLSNDGYFCFHRAWKLNWYLWRVLVFFWGGLFCLPNLQLNMRRDLKGECDKRKQTENCIEGEQVRERQMGEAVTQRGCFCSWDSLCCQAKEQN